VKQGSVLSPILYSLYTNDTPQTPGVYLGLSADDTHIYVTDRKEDYVLSKLQRGLCATETWCECWNIKINEDKTHLTANGCNIPFINHVKYLGVIFYKRITWRLHTEMIEAKAFRTFIKIYSRFKSQRLSSSIKLTLCKALIRSVMPYACPPGNWRQITYLLKLQRLQNKVLRTKVTTDPRSAYGFQPSVCMRYITKLCRQTSRSHTKTWEWTCLQHRTRQSPTQKI
jgi:hypothetical protein